MDRTVADVLALVERKRRRQDLPAAQVEGSFVVYSTRRNRVYRRRFDYDEAIRRYKAGETVSALARDYGVTGGAVARVVIPGLDERMRENAKEWGKGTCEECGGPTLRADHPRRRVKDGHAICGKCRAKGRRTRYRLDDDGRLIAVRCCAGANCVGAGGPWLPAELFTAGTAAKDLRTNGVHSLCRACQTATRRRYRHKHELKPCEDCGKPCYGRRCLECHRGADAPLT